MYQSDGDYICIDKNVNDMNNIGNYILASGYSSFVCWKQNVNNSTSLQYSDPSWYVKCDCDVGFNSPSPGYVMYLSSTKINNLIQAPIAGYIYSGLVCRKLYTSLWKEQKEKNMLMCEMCPIMFYTIIPYDPCS